MTTEHVEVTLDAEAPEEATAAASNGEVAVPDDKALAEWLDAEQDWRDTFSWCDTTTGWEHQWVEFEGDMLAVRKPLMRQLTAYSIGTGEFMSPEMRTGVTGKFMATLLSEESFRHVMDRYLDPDDEAYDDNTVGDLIRIVVEMTTGKMDTPANRAERRRAAKK